MDKPFWEKTYKDDKVATFGVDPNREIKELWSSFKQKCSILEVGCGEGKNSLFLAEKGFRVHAFDISEFTIQKVERLLLEHKLRLTTQVVDLRSFVFDKSYDVIISYGTLHFVEKNDWKAFIEKAKNKTNSGGLNIMQIFTNKVAASPDIAQFAVGLANEGGLFSLYKGWDIIKTMSHVFDDKHPGVDKHQHASNKIVAQKLQKNSTVN